MIKMDDDNHLALASFQARHETHTNHNNRSRGAGGVNIY